MKLIVPLVLLLACAASHAQQRQCFDHEGRVYWKPGLCAKYHLREAAEAAAGNARCPDGFTIATLQSRAARRDLSAGERAVAKAEWERANACGSQMTAAEKSQAFAAGVAADARTREQMRQRREPAGYVDPHSGTFYANTPGGYVNSRTGAVVPK